MYRAGGPQSQQQRKKPTGNVVENIKKMEQQREERRRKLEEMKQAKLDRQLQNEALGKNVDADFDLLIDQHKKKVSQALNHVSSSKMNLCVCVRKRPLFDKEYQAGEIDCVSASNPKIIVHECKLRVDGITKYIEDHEFKFDNVFSEQEDSSDVYEYQIKSLLPNLFKNGVVTCFAYGQTGSGKTYTVSATTELAVKDLYKMASQNRSLGVNFHMSFFEIYGGKVMDLLNGKKKLAILEDKYQKIQVQGLEEREARSVQEMLDIITFGHSVRTTHQTAANDTSSRSHAICQINVRDGNGKTLGKLLIVDLAGSERAQDTQSNNRQRRIEGAEINKSLLALKECIRAIDMKSAHVPFRASKLTMVLRDSFLKEGSSKIVMIACINPGSTSADHTLNTLRYALRLKSNSTSDYNNPAAIGYQQPKPQQQPAYKAQANVEQKPAQQKQQPLKEEKKRPEWVGVGDQPSKQEKKGKPKDEMKQKKKEDWNYLKSTINLGNGEQMIDPQLLTFHEKVDRIVEEEEELRNLHLQYLKESAQLLTQEGELISNVQGVGSVDYEIDDYVNNMERIIKRNIEIYSDLQRRMNKFKKHLREEEEAHQNVKDHIWKKRKSLINIKELLQRGGLADKDPLYDFDIVAALRKLYDLTYQQASMFLKAIKGPLLADQPYLSKQDFIKALSGINNSSNLKDVHQTTTTFSTNYKKDQEYQVTSEQQFMSPKLNTTKSLLKNQTHANLLSFKQSSNKTNYGSMSCSIQKLKKSLSNQKVRQQQQLPKTLNMNSESLKTDSSLRHLFSPYGKGTKTIDVKEDVYKLKNGSQLQKCQNLKSLQILTQPSPSSQLSQRLQNDLLFSPQSRIACLSPSKPTLLGNKNSNYYHSQASNDYKKSSYLKTQTLQDRLPTQQILDSTLSSQKRNKHQLQQYTTQQQRTVDHFYQTPTIQKRVQRKENTSFLNFKEKNTLSKESYFSPQRNRKQFLNRRKGDTVTNEYYTISNQQNPLNSTRHKHKDKTTRFNESKGELEYKRKLSFSNQNAVQLLTSPSNQDEEDKTNLETLKTYQSNNLVQNSSSLGLLTLNYLTKDTYEQDIKNTTTNANIQEKQLTSVVMKSNSKSRSNSFIRGSPSRYLQNSRNSKLDFTNDNKFTPNKTAPVSSEKAFPFKSTDGTPTSPLQKLQFTTNDSQQHYSPQSNIKEYINDIKQKFRDLNSQFDRRHSELFNLKSKENEHIHDENGFEEEEDQKHGKHQEQMMYYDSLYCKKLQQSRFTNWHKHEQVDNFKSTHSLHPQENHIQDQEDGNTLLNEEDLKNKHQNSPSANDQHDRNQSQSRFIQKLKEIQDELYHSKQSTNQNDIVVTDADDETLERQQENLQTKSLQVDNCNKEQQKTSYPITQQLRNSIELKLKTSINKKSTPAKNKYDQLKAQQHNQQQEEPFDDNSKISPTKQQNEIDGNKCDDKQTLGFKQSPIQDLEQSEYVKYERRSSSKFNEKLEAIREKMQSREGLQRISNDSQPQKSQITNIQENKQTFNEQQNNTDNNCQILSNQATEQVNNDNKEIGIALDNQEEEKEIVVVQQQEEQQQVDAAAGEINQTYAMDVNESFGLNSPSNPNGITSNYNNHGERDLDQHDEFSNKFSTPYRHDLFKSKGSRMHLNVEQVMTDPDEILKSIRGNVQRSMNESKFKSRKFDIEKQMRNTDYMRYQAANNKLVTIDQNDEESSEFTSEFPNSFSINSQQILEREREKIRRVNEEFERQQKLLQQMNIEDEDI